MARDRWCAAAPSARYCARGWGRRQRGVQAAVFPVLNVLLTCLPKNRCLAWDFAGSKLSPLEAALEMGRDLIRINGCYNLGFWQVSELTQEICA